MTTVFDRSCTTVSQLVTEYVEDALTPAQRLTFETHLVYCPGCSTFLSQMKAVPAALGSLPPDAVDEEERAALIETFRSRA
jgi:anti-sigma factor RsiW